eukprot:c7014_g1_i2.p2 GENE.c7014_g1_i2~~c7014_g1_i2.p2  ORF type:complete len:154 (-),score=23.67 c7014_g1_i2:65-526(-)
MGDRSCWAYINSTTPVQDTPPERGWEISGNTRSEPIALRVRHLGTSNNEPSGQSRNRLIVFYLVTSSETHSATIFAITNDGLSSVTHLPALESASAVQSFSDALQAIPRNPSPSPSSSSSNFNDTAAASSSTSSTHSTHPTHPTRRNRNCSIM